MMFKLLLAFQLKHLLADYFFQTEYMLQKTGEKKWFYPLLAHALMHGFQTNLLLVCFSLYSYMWLGLLDAIAHFFIDRLKVIASRNVSAANPTYWRLLGMDQALHHCTHYFLILLIVSN